MSAVFQFVCCAVMAILVGVEVASASHSATWGSAAVLAVMAIRQAVASGVSN